MNKQMCSGICDPTKSREVSVSLREERTEKRLNDLQVKAFSSALTNITNRVSKGFRTMIKSKLEEEKKNSTSMGL